MAFTKVAVGVLTAGFLTLLLTGCGASGGGSDATPTTAKAPSTTVALASTTTRQVRPAVDLEFRAVLAAAALMDGTCRPDPTSTSLPTEGTDGAESRDGHICYTLGPDGFDGGSIDTAHASRGPSNGWEVGVTVAKGDQAKANAVFNTCYDGGPTCPGQGVHGHGEIAIVLDGKVVSAPAVNGEDLASDGFVISGTFDEAEATSLADQLNR